MLQIALIEVCFCINVLTDKSWLFPKWHNHLQSTMQKKITYNGKDLLYKEVKCK